MKHAFLIPALLACSALPAQDFLNGSFEQNGKLCLINTSPRVFNANVKNTHAFGSFRKPDIASSECDFGTAKDGNWFIGLASNIESDIRSEVVTLELSAPLVKGNQYQINFWARSRSNAPNLELGVSEYDSLRGVNFYTVSAKTIGVEWSMVSLRFTAPTAGKYISVKASNREDNAGVWLDAFALRPVFVADNMIMIPKEEKPISKNSAPTQKQQTTTNAGALQVDVFPNPSEGMISVSTDSSQVVSMVVFNTLGTPVREYLNTPESPMPDKIDLTDQQPGLYFVEVATISGKVTKRVVVSR
ncbi:MAG: T9SS type A sorting domain-containing protein [Bacteroidia bacterium]